ncbi:protein CUSTOS [Elgaria multicarinata webbii]|uniref:protein CUSTOS n=1 Tax=Elgaria multicarinata webbii TaxID=159646 RepID=UPI002FCD67E2
MLGVAVQDVRKAAGRRAAAPSSFCRRDHLPLPWRSLPAGPGLQSPACSAAEGASNMAAAGSSGGSSGEEEEGAAALALARLREATWDPALLRNPTGGILKKSKLSSAESSIRERASGHGQDGNELQTTPEFRAHVAKKLGAILDSSIKPVEPPLWPLQKDMAASRTEDDGFRLFSSSVPGDCGKPEPLPSGRRRHQRSSSSELDSDQEWQRCQEAAVTAADILKQGGLLAVLQDSGQDQSSQATEPSMKKRRKKSKLKGKSNGEQDAKDSVEKDQADTETEGSSCLNGACKRAENTGTEGGVMAKKKKKKTKKRKTVQARAE